MPPIRISLLFLACLGLLGTSFCCSQKPDAASSAFSRIRRPDQSFSAHPLVAPPDALSVSSNIRFRNRASAAGLRYRWTIPGPRPLTILPTMGNGCAFLDYDNDGNMDILLVGSKLALYRGDGRGHFTDVTTRMGLDRLHGHFLGCAVGDYDNDGYADLYISGYHTGVLLHNEHGKAFKDVTAAMGLASQPWGTSAAFADLDGDGYLDLYICNYVEFGPKSRQLCQVASALTPCNPMYYKTLHGVFYHNLQGRRFEDTTELWGGHGQTGNGLGVACADFDGSGRVGLAIADDGMNGDLFQNLGHGKLQNINRRSGTADGSNGHTHAGMGIDWADVENSGKLDLFVTTFSHEEKTLYHNEGDGLFTARSDARIDAALFPDVSFGCKFADFDNDGWLDLMVASGHVWDNADRIEPGMRYREPIELFQNRGQSPASFAWVSQSAGLTKLPPIIGRGLAVGDFDNDGRVDALVVDSEGAPLLLQNETPHPGHWIGFKLVGTGSSNRDAYGAQVTVTLSNGQTRMRQCHPGGSYLSSSDPRVHVGLGKEKVRSVLVRWPNGAREVWKIPSVNRYVTLVQGMGSGAKAPASLLLPRRRDRQHAHG